MRIGEKNVGKTDRIIRIIAGIILLIVSAMGFIGSPFSYILIVAAFILLVTGMIGSCTVYSFLGISTRK